MALTSLNKSIDVLVNLCFLFSLALFLLLFFFLPFSRPSPIHGCETTVFFNLRSADSSDPHGYIDYLHLFHCVFVNSPALAFILLALWLLVLLYLLGNTASNYFCSSLESLSNVLHLSPTIAGVTFLSLGNGAPDLFSSIVSFAAGGGKSGVEIGLSSVLGGAFFVSSAVLAIISISVSRSSRPAISIDRVSFIRDICFLIVTLSFLLLILIIGQIRIWEAMFFVSLYIIYIIMVSMNHCCGKDSGELSMPLLESIEVQQPQQTDKEIDSYLSSFNSDSSVPNQSWLLYLIELPLYLPRRLTIPVITEERWSKPFAVASVTLSPILLATLWNSRGTEMNSEHSTTVLLFASLLGLLLGVAAMECTANSHPPKRLQLPWLLSGFLMSVVWTYIIAGELVSLLVSIGEILGVRPSVLGVTVLAWGNSLGDLVADVAMAVNGGENGAQVAVAGCYAGPIFNTLVGLGISFVVSTVKAYPSPFVIVSKDDSEFVLIGFLIGGFLWALVMLPMKGMKLSRALGIGLLAIYCCFICMRVLQSFQILNFGVSLNV
ncbi:cation/calcium exchanger 1-like [Phalaenopsis equestris]|uniref:cation/calcium exchanger 1-like n=1 Tax=Phalaenopsis equestris TaxID=78828 RepID=UPI0009E2F46F|nr:cation/calcium exchanger 1-like [Phalaenopsis equestris]